MTDSIYATTGLATTTHFWRVRGVNSRGRGRSVVGRAQLHAAAGSAAGGAGLDRHQSRDGGGRQSLERHGGAERPAPATAAR